MFFCKLITEFEILFTFLSYYADTNNGEMIEVIKPAAKNPLVAMGLNPIHHEDANKIPQMIAQLEIITPTASCKCCITPARKELTGFEEILREDTADYLKLSDVLSLTQQKNCQFTIRLYITKQ